jgi:hypothetical protein
MPVENAADLYALPVEDFTNARNALAARLKAEGEADEATRVLALKKPSIAAWALNQLARRSRAGLEESFRLRDEVEAATSAVELRARTEERRKALAGLVAEAKTILAEGGHAVSASTVEKISRSLLAADDDSRGALLNGTLERELTGGATGSFGAFGSFDAMSVTFEDDTPDPHLERLAAEAESAEQEAGRLEALATEADEAAQAARDLATQARRQAVRARERADAVKNR